MKVLVVGGGGREHALVWKIYQSLLAEKVFYAAKIENFGISRDGGIYVPIDPNDIKSLVKFAQKYSIGLTVVGPEEPLTKGIVDAFEKEGLLIVGPSRLAAEIESSKSFAKDRMKECGIPTAPYKVYDDYQKAINYIHRHGAPVVVKYDGLAAGKGVFVCRTTRQARLALHKIMKKKIFGDTKVVIEDFLKGVEASYMAFTDGKNILPLATSQDHKDLEEHNFRGAKTKTGGMGAYSPAPIITKEIKANVLVILRQLIDTMAKAGRPYRGVIYLGLIIVKGKPYVLEVNCRLGDPEAQPVLMRMESDIVPILLACAKGEGLDKYKIEWKNQAALCQVIASKGYPQDAEKWDQISEVGLIKVAKMEEVKVFHAATMVLDGHFVTTGGRVLGVTSLGSYFREETRSEVAESIGQAKRVVDEAARLLAWNGSQRRTDIGYLAINKGK